MSAPLQQVGHALPRRDGRDKVSGRAVYGPDIALPGMLHAKLLRSPRAHARVVSIDASAARALPGVRAVLTRDDIPPNVVPFYGYFIKDQPMVAGDRVRFIGDIVCAVAADSEAQAVDALRAIRVDYADLPVAASIEAAGAINDWAAPSFKVGGGGGAPFGSSARILARVRAELCGSPRSPRA